MKEIYRVQNEADDKGWHAGDVCFTEASDAVKHMRKYVAHEIMDARADGCKVDYLCIFKDTAMGTKSNQATQTISFRITDRNGKTSHVEYRVWASQLFGAGEYKVDERFGYYQL